MPLRSNKLGETVQWFKKAFQDIESAKILFEANKPTQWHQVLFFCQQAVEKSMKGFLTWHKIKFRWTHDLVELGAQVTKIDASLAKSVATVNYLSDYAWEFRYPSEDSEPTKAEAKSGIKLGEEFFEAILNKLPEDIPSSLK